MQDCHNVIKFLQFNKNIVLSMDAFNKGQWYCYVYTENQNLINREDR